MTKRTYGPYSVDHFLHSISWKWLTTEVLFHLPFKSVTHSSKGAVPTFARDSLWPRPHVSDMCARIRVFLNPPLFLSGFKNFHVHTCPYSNGICPSTRIRRKLAHRIPNAPTITRNVIDWEKPLHFEWKANARESGEAVRGGGTTSSRFLSLQLALATPFGAPRPLLLSESLLARCHGFHCSERWLHQHHNGSLSSKRTIPIPPNAFVKS